LLSSAVDMPAGLKTLRAGRGGQIKDISGEHQGARRRPAASAFEGKAFAYDSGKTDVHQSIAENCASPAPAICRDRAR